MNYFSGRYFIDYLQRLSRCKYHNTFLSSLFMGLGLSPWSWGRFIPRGNGGGVSSMSMGNTSMLIDIDVDDQKKWVTARTISRLRCNSQLKTTSNNFRLDFEHDDVAEATTGIQGDSYIHSFPLRSDNDVSE